MYAKYYYQICHIIENNFNNIWIENLYIYMCIMLFSQYAKLRDYNEAVIIKILIID